MLLVLFEVVQFAFKCNHHGNPQESPPHTLVINTQTLKHFRGKTKKKSQTSQNILFYFFPTYDEFFALPFLAAVYRDLACFIQSRSVPDPWHCCSIQIETQNDPLTLPDLNPRSCHVPAHHISSQMSLGRYKTDEEGGGRRDGDGLLSHMHREEDRMYAASPPKLLFNGRLF